MATTSISQTKLEEVRNKASRFISSYCSRRLSLTLIKSNLDFRPSKQRTKLQVLTFFTKSTIPIMFGYNNCKPSSFCRAYNVKVSRLLAQTNQFHIFPLFLVIENGNELPEAIVLETNQGDSVICKEHT